MSKRFYLCNLIPLWNIDDEALDADWVVEKAAAGEFVELRVAVTEGPLDPKAPDFFVKFEIYEDDFLLSGFRDDLTASITSQSTEAGDGMQVRPVRTIPATAAVPDVEKDQAIFVSPHQGGGLIRCFWKAERVDDVSGDPEFYFDVTVGLNGRKAEERATRTLTVGPAAPVSGDRKATAAGAAAVVTAAGWTSSHVTLDSGEVEMVARIVGGEPGMTLRFEILDTQTQSEIIEQVDAPVGTSPIVWASWRPRRPLPEDAWGPLKFRAFFENVADRTTTSAPHRPGAIIDNELFATVRPVAPLELVLVDEAGRPRGNQPYALLDGRGDMLVSSKTGSGGVILWPGEGEQDILAVAPEQITVELPGLTALNATEEQPPKTDSADGTVFTLIDIRPNPAPK